MFESTSLKISSKWEVRLMEIEYSRKTFMISRYTTNPGKQDPFVLLLTTKFHDPINTIH